MAKSTKTYMTRRGRRYLIERKQDGTFGKFIPISKTAKVKKEAVKKTKTTKTNTATLVA